MNKILLIISREYITRVRKRSFVIMSLLGPLLFGAMFIIPVWLASREGEQKVVEVLDESGLFRDKLQSGENIQFVYINQPLDSAKRQLKDGGLYGLLYIPQLDLKKPAGITFFARNNPSFDVQMNLENSIERQIEDIKLKESGFDREKLESIKTNVNINTINITPEGEKKGDTAVATIIGYLFSLLIYFFIFLYGVQTLRGVIEEKTNRIVEVIISSVRPFQLMMGKIIGICAVGLTQFLLWIVLTGSIYAGVRTYFNINQVPAQQMQMMNNPEMTQVGAHAQEIFSRIENINFPLILGSFIFYFLGAYLFYGALFAAIGSAVDSDSDAQQFQLPITLPLIFSIIILAAVLKDPQGNLAFWTSIIPFTSPIVMMMRMPFVPPLWQIGLSMMLLILGIVFNVWLASRIYRVGILMHGTKVNYKTLAKWFIMKN